MERRPPDFVYFPQLLQRSLMVDAAGGINTFRLEITQPVEIKNFTWIGHFPFAYGSYPGLAAGEKTGGVQEPMPFSYVKELLYAVEVPEASSPEDMTMSPTNPSDKIPPVEVFSQEMPNISVVFLPGGILSTETMAFLRALKDLDPGDSLQTLRESFDLAMEARR